MWDDGPESNNTQQSNLRREGGYHQGRRCETRVIIHDNQIWRGEGGYHRGQRFMTRVVIHDNQIWRGEGWYHQGRRFKTRVIILDNQILQGEGWIYLLMLRRQKGLTGGWVSSSSVLSPCTTCLPLPHHTPLLLCSTTAAAAAAAINESPTQTSLRLYHVAITAAHVMQPPSINPFLLTSYYDILSGFIVVIVLPSLFIVASASSSPLSLSSSCCHCCLLLRLRRRHHCRCCYCVVFVVVTSYISLFSSILRCPLSQVKLIVM